jgi:ADP-ribosylglycohydrolase
MSLAIAEAMVANEPWTPEFLAQRFVDVFKRDPREGYAGSFYGFLQEVRTGTEFLHRIRPASDKSGAAMRATPIGVLGNLSKVIRHATIQAAITHNTPGGVQSAVAAALMTHYFRHRLGRKADLGSFLKLHVAGPWEQTWRGKVGPKGMMSVHAAFTAILGCRSMSELLRSCIAFTGDVDTVATIALAAGSFSEEIQQDLPKHLYAELENGPYGRDYLQSLDEELLAKV